jgi:hypothetical protein
MESLWYKTPRIEEIKISHSGNFQKINSTHVLHWDLVPNTDYYVINYSKFVIIYGTVHRPTLMVLDKTMVGLSSLT